MAIEDYLQGFEESQGTGYSSVDDYLKGFGPPEEPQEDIQEDESLGWSDAPKQAARGLMHGVLGLAESADTGIQYVGERLGMPKVAAAGKRGYENVKRLREPWAPPEQIQGSIYKDPGLMKDPAWWAYNVMEMVPSLSATIIPGMGAYKSISVGGKALKLAPEVIKRIAIIGASVAGGAVGGSLEGAQTYQSVLEKGGSEEEAARAGEMMSAFSAGLNAISAGRMIGGGGAASKIARHLGTGAIEGVTELAEEPAEVAATDFAKRAVGLEPPPDMLGRMGEATKEGLNVLPIAALTGVGGSVMTGAGRQQESVKGPREPGEPIDLLDMEQLGLPGREELLGLPAPTEPAGLLDAGEYEQPAALPAPDYGLQPEGYPAAPEDIYSPYDPRVGAVTKRAKELPARALPPPDYALQPEGYPKAPEDVYSPYPPEIAETEQIGLVPPGQEAGITPEQKKALDLQFNFSAPVGEEAVQVPDDVSKQLRTEAQEEAGADTIYEIMADARKTGINLFGVKKDFDTRELTQKWPAIFTSNGRRSLDEFADEHGMTSDELVERIKATESKTKLTEKLYDEKVEEYERAESDMQDALAEAEEKTDTEPTEAQKEAGNYQKGKVKLHGFDFSVENPAGSTRSGTDADGKPWSIEMQDTYGYLKGTVGKDKDHLDVFVNPEKPESDKVYVVDQINKDRSFDEHKVIFGAENEKEAQGQYLRNYEKNWTGLGAITEMGVEEFKEWTKGDTTKAVALEEKAETKEAPESKLPTLEKISDKLEITIPTEIEETGETKQVKYNAKAELTEAREEEGRWQKLLDCLKS